VRTIGSWPTRSSSESAGIFAPAPDRGRPTERWAHRRWGRAKSLNGRLFSPIRSRCRSISSFARKVALRAKANSTRANALACAGRQARMGGRLDKRPALSSLGLLPSGPDPVGERYVLRQPPGAYVGPWRDGTQGARRALAPSERGHRADIVRRCFVFQALVTALVS